MSEVDARANRHVRFTLEALELNDEDLRALEHQLMEKPHAGKVMRNTGGVRKVRFAPPSRGSGKRGAFRLCYFYLPAHGTIFFVLLFPKSEQPNLTNEGDSPK